MTGTLRIGGAAGFWGEAAHPTAQLLAVEKGDMLVVLEAMRMQHRVVAAVAGTLSGLCVDPDRQVAAGAVLAEPEEN